MALALSKLESLRDQLIRNRLSGILSVTDQNGERVEYKNDAQMAAALRHVESAIAEFGTSRPKEIKFTPSKGL